MDTDETQELPPLHTVTPTQDWVRAHRLRLVEKAAAAEREDDAAWLTALRAHAEGEVAAWARYTCGGNLETVTACADAMAEACDRRDHVMCPRRRLAEAVREERGRRRSMRTRLVREGVPERALQAVFDAPALETHAVTALRAAMARTPQPLFYVLAGGVGVGKSCAAALWLAERGGGAWVTAGEVARIGAYDREARARLDEPNLVLDDLGVEYLDGKSYGLAVIDDLIDSRHANLRPLVITTNLGAKDFQTRYGVRVWDRLREVGAWVKVEGSSLRGKL